MKENFIHKSKFNKYILIVILITFPACLSFFSKSPEIDYMKNIETIADLKNLFPTNATMIKEQADQALAQAHKEMDSIIDVPNDERTFDNTPRAFDTTIRNFQRLKLPIMVLTMVHPDDDMRNIAQEQEIRINQASVELLAQNKPFYEGFKYYYTHQAPHEQLTPEQRYFIDELMKEFKQAGLELPDEERKRVIQLQKEISEISSTFDMNINTDQSAITATKDELEGQSNDFINALKKTKDGLYIVGTDYPTYFTVMENAQHTSLRKRLYRAFLNRGYPKNYEVLNQLRKKRHQLAQLLGYDSYAHLDIDNEMANNPETVMSFLDDLTQKAQGKAKNEFERITSDLPKGVTLSENNKLFPWDTKYSTEHYKRKHLNVNKEKIREFFPMEHTVQELMDIYQRFFNLTFIEKPLSGLWNNDLSLIEVYKEKEFIGYIILDLYPRTNKFSHACQAGIIHAGYTPDGKRIPSTVLVIANFPKSTPEKPSLLKHDEVKTFFHEFGHALHSLLGATELNSQAGTNVKTDFVELPSQMLEEWLWDKEILKKVSSHYQTGEPLPDDLIEKLIELKQFGSGSFIMGQSYYGLLALSLFGPDYEKSIDDIQHQLHERLLKHVEFDEKEHMPAGFGHLTCYGSKYYGYLWSKVFALDLANHIKQFGFLNPEVGTVYADKVLSKGGSKDPNELLEDFLGRKPNNEAFIKDLGL